MGKVDAKLRNWVFSFNESQHIVFQNAFEAQFLVNQLQLYFSGSDVARTRLLEKFHFRPHEFKHNELLQQLESLDLNAVTSEKKEK